MKLIGLLILLSFSLEGQIDHCSFLPLDHSNFFIRPNNINQFPITLVKEKKIKSVKFGYTTLFFNEEGFLTRQKVYKTNTYYYRKTSGDTTIFTSFKLLRKRDTLTQRRQTFIDDTLISYYSSSKRKKYNRTIDLIQSENKLRTYIMDKDSVNPTHIIVDKKYRITKILNRHRSDSIYYSKSLDTTITSIWSKVNSDTSKWILSIETKSIQGVKIHEKSFTFDSNESCHFNSVTRKLNSKEKIKSEQFYHGIFNEFRYKDGMIFKIVNYDSFLCCTPPCKPYIITFKYIYYKN